MGLEVEICNHNFIVNDKDDDQNICTKCGKIIDFSEIYSEETDDDEEDDCYGGSRKPTPQEIEDCQYNGYWSSMYE